MERNAAFWRRFLLDLVNLVNLVFLVNLVNPYFSRE